MVHRVLPRHRHLYIYDLLAKRQQLTQLLINLVNHLLRILLVIPAAQIELLQQFPLLLALLLNLNDALPSGLHPAFAQLDLFMVVLNFLMGILAVPTEVPDLLADVGDVLPHGCLEVLVGEGAVVEEAEVTEDFGGYIDLFP